MRILSEQIGRTQRGQSLCRTEWASARGLELASRGSGRCARCTCPVPSTASPEPYGSIPEVMRQSRGGLAWRGGEASTSPAGLKEQKAGRGDGIQRVGPRVWSGVLSGGRRGVRMREKLGP